MKDHSMKPNTTLAIALSAGIAATLAASPVHAAKPEMEKCYGVAKAGKNECAAGPGTSCAGTASRDWQGNAWKLVPKGSCVRIQTPRGPGSLTPIDR
ncbi:MAG: DUF2282 domain-containing protein [Dechloromonas sp.]|nr:DUF2282 domain-containing protein [Dechloromonas sp.]